MAAGAQRCLVISDGRRGIENQALGLAESCARHRDLLIQTHHIDHNAATAALPPKAQLKLARFDLPGCEIAIGCGRQAIAPLLWLRRNRPDVFTVYVQDPRIDPSEFDLVVAPEHDGLTGPNVVQTIGSPNRVTDTRIIGETLNFAERLSALPQPCAALLIGGPSKTHEMDAASQAFHLGRARQLHTKGYGVLVTTSRRTPDAVVAEWRDFGEDHKNVWLHTADSTEPNPYFAFLGAADLILVTEDSTNMLTESCATGKPVYRLPMGGAPGKFAALYDRLEARCNVRLYNGETDAPDYAPLEETERAAEAVWATFDRARNPDARLN